MIYQESSRVRRVVGRLDAGDDCVDQITEFCREHGITAGEVRAIGQLDHVELVRFREGEGYATTFEGDGEFDVLQMSGNVAVLGDEPVVRLESVLAVEGPAGPQVLTGQLRSGRVVEMEFVLEVFDDLEMTRKMNPESGRLDLHAIKQIGGEPKKQEAPPAAEAGGAGEQASESTASSSATSGSSEASDESSADEESMTGQSMSWDDAADESEQVAKQDAGSRVSTEDESTEDESDDDPFGDVDLDAPMLAAGDILKHPQLGDCRVMKVEEDDYAHIRLPRGKIRKLSLEVVNPKFVEEDDDRNIFEAQIRR